MGTPKQKSIKFEPWMREAIQALSNRDTKGDFSKEVNNLLVLQLFKEGYTEARYLAKKMGRVDENYTEIPTPQASGESR